MRIFKAGKVEFKKNADIMRKADLIKFAAAISAQTRIYKLYEDN